MQGIFSRLGYSDEIFELKTRDREESKPLKKRSLKDQSKPLTSIRREHETSDIVNSNLAKERSVLEEENQSLRSETEALKERIIEQQSKLLTSIRHDHAVLAKNNTNLINETSFLETKNKSLRIELEALREQIKSLSKQLSPLKQGMESSGDKIGKGSPWKEGDQQQILNSLRADLIALRSDNDELRKYVAEKETEQQHSLRNQQYYIQQFQELKAVMEMWIVKHSKSSAAKELSQYQETELLKLLTSLGKSGKKSAEFLNTKPQLFQKLYGNTRSRILLVRHIIAVFLIDQVFEPFDAELPSSLLQAIGSLVVSHESLEPGIFQLLESHFKQREENIGPEMANIFRLMFPQASDEDIQKAVSKFTSKAVALKIAMTKVAGCHCYWIIGGKQFDTKTMEIADEEFGSVYLCTFPGLARTVKVKEQEDGKQILMEVKAAVVLRSAFGDEENEDNVADENADNLSDEDEDNLSDNNEYDLSDENEDDLFGENEDDLFDENEES